MAVLETESTQCVCIFGYFEPSNFLSVSLNKVEKSQLHMSKY